MSRVEQFSDMGQQDAQEFLRFILDGLARGEEKVAKDQVLEKKWESREDSEVRSYERRTSFIQKFFGGYLCNHSNIGPPRFFS